MVTILIYRIVMINWRSSWNTGEILGMGVRSLRRHLPPTVNHSLVTFLGGLGGCEKFISSYSFLDKYPKMNKFHKISRSILVSLISNLFLGHPYADGNDAPLFLCLAHFQPLAWGHRSLYVGYGLTGRTENT